MMSFANIPLSDQIGSPVEAWIAANIRPSELFPLAFRKWPQGLIAGPVLEVTPEHDRPVTIGTLFWPTGASRFAQAHFVVNEGQLAAIRAFVNIGGTTQTANLVFDDGKTQVTTAMWMLPAWPLSTAAPGQGADIGAQMYLLTLVDDRYWWWGIPLQMDVTPGVTTWLNLYDAISAAIGRTISVNAINAAYSLPVADYASAYRPLPNVLDAIAFSVGQRIVRNTDGSITAQNATTAIASVTAQLAANVAALNPKYAGGTFSLLPG